MVSIITTLNVVYGVTSPRPWWRRQLVAVVLTVVFSVLALAALLSVVFGERVGQAAAAWAGLGGVFTGVWSLLQWPLGLLFVLTGIDLVYHLAPAVRQRWYWLTPGSVFAGVAWTVVSLGLRAYVSHFANYNATYGSIGGRDPAAPLAVPLGHGAPDRGRDQLGDRAGRRRARRGDRGPPRRACALELRRPAT